MVSGFTRTVSHFSASQGTGSIFWLYFTSGMNSTSRCTVALLLSLLVSPFMDCRSAYEPTTAVPPNFWASGTSAPLWALFWSPPQAASAARASRPGNARRRVVPAMSAPECEGVMWMERAGKTARKRSLRLLGTAPLGSFPKAAAPRCQIRRRGHVVVMERGPPAPPPRHATRKGLP